MPRAAKDQPKRLGLKLRQIRKAFDLTQEELKRRLGFKGLAQGSIAAYERNTRTPSLYFLLAIARMASVSVEALIDDELDIPDKLPAKIRQGSIRRKRSFSIKNP